MISRGVRRELNSSVVISRSRKWVPPGFYNLKENPPKSPFFKGGLSKGFRKVPPFDKGGIGGISLRGQVKRSNLLNAPINKSSSVGKSQAHALPEPDVSLSTTLKKFRWLPYTLPGSTPIPKP